MARPFPITKDLAGMHPVTWCGKIMANVLLFVIIVSVIMTYANEVKLRYYIADITGAYSVRQKYLCVKKLSWVQSRQFNVTIYWYWQTLSLFI